MLPGFIEAIRDAGADDTPRLVAADFLEESDPERAVFSRERMPMLNCVSDCHPGRISGSEGVSQTPTDPDHNHPSEKGPVMATADSTVQYRHIPEFPGYRVGDDGSVWSRWQQQSRPGCGRRGFKSVLADEWRRLRATEMKNGYLGVSLRRNGRGHTQSVHALVATAFLGPCPSGMECAHENGNRHDCRLGNLAWKTKKDNQADRLRHGTDSRGERSGNAKLTAVSVVMMLDEWVNGATVTQLSRQFGVDRRTAGRIVRGEAWTHVPRRSGEAS